MIAQVVFPDKRQRKQRIVPLLTYIEMMNALPAGRVFGSNGI